MYCCVLLITIALVIVVVGTESGGSHVSPLTPAELLLALHNIDATKVDMKTLIKGMYIDCVSQ